MTPSQIDRAVRAALLDVLPPMVEEVLTATVQASLPRLIASLRTEIQQHLYGTTTTQEAIGDAVLGEAWHRHWAVVTAPPEPSSSPSPAPREDAPRGGTARRLTPEQVGQLWGLRDQGLSIAAVAKRLGVAIGSVQYRLSQPRPGAAEPPAPSVQPGPPQRHAGPRNLSGSQAARVPLEALPAIGLQAVPASLDDAADWLTGALQRERLSAGEIEQRLAILTPAGVLRECNTRRLALGLPPYQVIGRAA